MIREDLVASAVTFLQDPSVTASPVSQRVAFLQSKNLTGEEVEAALARAGEDPSSVHAALSSASNASQYTGYPPSGNQQVMRSTPLTGGYGAYQGPGAGQYWQPAAPAELPRRDWRDWFIMATVVSGVSYGLFAVAKRYIYPLVAPPTPPQLEQDKAAIDASFEKAFALLDQLSTDTAALKASEQTRTENLDSALQEVESVISELKAAGRRREDDARRISDEVRSLKDLIPRAMESHKETTDNRLRDLNTELKGLKTLLGNRMGGAASVRPAPASSTNTYTPSTPSVNGTFTSNQTTPPTRSSAAGAPSGLSSTARPLSSASVPAPSATTIPDSGRPESPLPMRVGPGSGRAAIPAWQMAAAAKKDTAQSAAVSSSGSAQESASGAA